MDSVYAEIVAGTDILSRTLEAQAARADVLTIVEIGTWTGMGSTTCILNGITKSGNYEKHFLTFEIDETRHAQAARNLAKYTAVLPNFRVVNGTVISGEEMPDFDKKVMNRENYDGDYQKLAASICRFDLIPSHIDMLFLDGGDIYESKEFEKLFDRSRIILLDDTNGFKNGESRMRLLKHRNFYKIFDDLELRNGSCCYERRNEDRGLISIFTNEYFGIAQLFFFKVKRRIRKYLSIIKNVFGGT